MTDKVRINEAHAVSRLHRRHEVFIAADVWNRGQHLAKVAPARAA